MRVLPSQLCSLRSPPRCGCAIRRLAAFAALVLALLSPPAFAADEDLTDNPLAPEWFRKLSESVRSNSQRARTEGETKLATALAAGDRATEYYARHIISTALRRQNDFSGALIQSRAALILAETLPDNLIRFNAHYLHGINLSVFGDLAGAIDHLLRALRLSDGQPSPRARYLALTGLGMTYDRLADFPQALRYKREALALAEQGTDEHAISLCAGNLANLEEKLGDLAAARRHYERALALTRRSGNRTETADIEESLIMLDFAEGKSDSILAALDPILVQRRTLRGKIKLTNTLLNRAAVCQKLGRLDEALAHAEEARGYADAGESPRLRANAYRSLASVQEARGDLAAALAATRREFAEREAMAGEAAKTRAAELQTQFEAAKKDAELARLSRENELRAAEQRAQEAQLARQAAELRANTAELRAKDAELAHISLTRYLLGTSLGAAILALAAVLAFQRYRARNERRLLDETRRARDSAIAADQVKTRFLGIASHDIRAPLGNILNLTDTVRAESRDGQPSPDLDLITAEAQRVLGLVEDLLATATLESGKLVLRPTPSDLTEITLAVVSGLRWQARTKRQALVFDPPAPEVGRLVGDAARLYQVVANLITNAIKFSPSDSTITVRLARAPSVLTLSIQDQGPGLAPDDIAKLFIPFERRAALPTARESSHGLGLSIAHEIVTLHGGEIRIESTSGRGATFFVDLPVTS